MGFKPSLFVKPAAIAFICLAMLLPLGVLLVGGLVYLWKMDFLLPALLSWLGLTGLSYIFYKGWPIRLLDQLSKTDEGTEIEEKANRELNALELTIPSYWSTAESELWFEVQALIEELLLQKLEWDQLPAHMVLVLTKVSENYHAGKKQTVLNFTLPELLLVVSIVSERYREVLKEQVPFSDKITVAQLMLLYNKQPSLMKSYRRFNSVRRMLRLSNPVSAMVGEIRELMANHVFDDISGSMTRAMQRLLLQEVAQVGIDLYSGMLKVSDAELSAHSSYASSADLHQTADTNEPVRVVFMGQVSAGKSSLINALLNHMAAEVDPLPTTERVVVHKLENSEGEALHLVDTPGAQDSADEITELVSIAMDADIIVWVSRINQPARATDKALYENLKQEFLLQPARKFPPIILVLTHQDTIAASEADTASAHIKAAIGLPSSVQTVTLSAREHHEHNIELLIAELSLSYALGLQNQMNRRRVELSHAKMNWRGRWKQASSLGKSLGKPMLSSLSRGRKMPFFKRRNNDKNDTDKQ